MDPREEAIIGPDGDRGWGIGLASGALVGLGQTGFFFEMGWAISGFVILLGAAIAGFFVGAVPKARIAFTFPFVVMGIGIAIATAWYADGRRHMVNLELLLPIAIGVIPGLLVYLVVKRLLLARVETSG